MHENTTTTNTKCNETSNSSTFLPTRFIFLSIRFHTTTMPKPSPLILSKLRRNVPIFSAIISTTHIQTSQYPQATIEVVLYVTNIALDIQWLIDFGPPWAKGLCIPLLCIVPLHACALISHQLTRESPDGFDPRGPRPEGIPWYRALPIAIITTPLALVASPLLALLDIRVRIWLFDPIELFSGQSNLYETVVPLPFVIIQAIVFY